MAGGLLNHIAHGPLNNMIHGNPDRTFFRSAFSKFSNFGLQKFRINNEGTTLLNMTTSTTFEFKIPRYGDLLMGTYMAIDLPDIWSTVGDSFKWIEDVGTQMIESVEFTCGGRIIQTFSGQYLSAIVKRDFEAKRTVYDQMTGNIPELYDPAAYWHSNQYPGYKPDSSRYMVRGTYIGPEPSIRGRTLYVPLNVWWTLSPKMAFPLVSMQYAELKIKITIRNVIF